jgi:BASS family bile acid:Na+ symporter
MLMLALLLGNAGLGIQTAHLKNLLCSPFVLFAGLIVNIAIPISLLFGVTLALRWWHNSDEVHHILIGLALVTSMPIAGSSTAWAQNANGNLALSLGLVLVSTLLSPLITPLSLKWIALVTAGEYAENMHALAGSGTAAFLMVCVLLPSFSGIIGRALLGEKRLASAKPFLKLINSFNLLLLNYSNASASLPQAVADPDWDFLAVTLGIVSGMCIVAFASGWLLGRLLKTDRTQQTALMFGLGMNNTGTGLVLASVALAGHPMALLPIILFNLVQHLVAGCVDFSLCRTPADSVVISGC